MKYTLLLKENEEKQKGKSDDKSDGNSESDDDQSDGQGDGDSKDGDKLAKANAGKPSNTSQAGGVWDAVSQDGKPLTEKERADAQRKLDNQVRLSESVERSCGKGAGENVFRGRLDSIDTEIANYLEKIQDWLVSVFPDQTSWNRPHRNHIWKDSTYKKGNYLPSRVSSVMGGTLAIAIDVSESTRHYLKAFATQVQGLIEQCNIEKVKVCWCSTTVYKDEKGEWWDEFDISAGEQLDLVARGGGGTELTPIFNLLNEYTDDVADIQGLIVFTDGEFTPVKADKEPDIPVLWATTDEIPNWYHKTDVNFGEVIHLPPIAYKLT